MERKKTAQILTLQCSLQPSYGENSICKITQLGMAPPYIGVPKWLTIMAARKVASTVRDFATNNTSFHFGML